MTPNVCCGQNLLNNLGLKLWDLLSHLVSFCLMFKFSLYSFPPLSENSRSFVTLMNCLILNLSKPTELAPTRKPVRICDLLKNVSLSLPVCVFQFFLLWMAGACLGSSKAAVSSSDLLLSALMSDLPPPHPLLAVRLTPVPHWVKFFLPHPAICFMEYRHWLKMWGRKCCCPGNKGHRVEVLFWKFLVTLLCIFETVLNQSQDSQIEETIWV